MFDLYTGMTVSNIDVLAAAGDCQAQGKKCDLPSLSC